MDTTKTFRDKMIDFYHQVKTPIDFISHVNFKPNYLIQNKKAETHIEGEKKQWRF